MSLAELRQHRDQIQVIAARYGIHNIRVFGSVARDTAQRPGRPWPQDAGLA